MAVTATPIFPQSLISKVTQFTSSTSTSVPTQLLAAQTNGAKIESILVASTNNAAVDLELFLQISSTNYLIGRISIPANAGNSNSVPVVNLFTAVNTGQFLLPLPKDSNGNPYLYLDSSTSLYALPQTALTSSDVWNIAVMGGAF